MKTRRHFNSKLLNLFSTVMSRIIFDLRKVNSKLNSVRFETFWDTVTNLFTKYQATVQEHRKGELSYLTFAISVVRFDKFCQGKHNVRKPNIDFPSEERVWFQFTLSNPFVHASSRHTGQFPIKFMVQAIFDNYLKFAVHDHILVSKFWCANIRGQTQKSLYHVSYLLPSNFSNNFS